jgi:hypothetical protein
MKYVVRDAFVTCAMQAERLELPDSAAWIRERLRHHEKSGSLEKYKFRVTSFGEWIESSAIDEVEMFICALLRTQGDASDPNGHAAAELERHLRKTAVIIRREGVVPKREHDVQAVMHKHLKNVFDGFVKNPSFATPLVTFKPDCGINDLQAAIEFKYVETDDEMKIAFHGILEDLSGYKSKDWTRFFSVVYMTAPFETEGRFHQAIQATGNARGWTTILVTGPGGIQNDIHGSVAKTKRKKA